MSLIIATGTNLGDRIKNLNIAKTLLCDHFQLIAASRIYTSCAVGKTDQPEFLNQVLEFNTPEITPKKCLETMLNIEEQMGRVRIEKWGPRLIDLDIIFWDELNISEDNLIIPHPYWKERSFVVKPLMELPYYNNLKNKYNINLNFEIDAEPIESKD